MKINMKGSSSRVVIDGKEFVGRSISINGNTVEIDGVKQNGTLVGDINIEVHGNAESLSNESGQVNADNVGTLSTMSGDVICNDVLGSVKTMSGDVRADKISGSVSTMSGDVTSR